MGNPNNLSAKLNSLNSYKSDIYLNTFKNYLKEKKFSGRENLH